jgi:hypothetical protein
MTLSAIDATAVVVPPAISGGANWSASVGTTHAVYVVHADWLGRRVKLASYGGRAAWVFGTSTSVEADVNAVVTGTPPAWTTNAKTGSCTADGGSEDFFIPTTTEAGVAITHFSVECSAASTYCQIIPSDLKTPRPAFGHTPT